MSKNRSNASLKKLLRAGYMVALSEPEEGLVHVMVSGGEIGTTESAQGATVGTACSEVLRKLEAKHEDV